MSRTRPSESASSRGGVPAPTFNLIASTTAFGPPVDISMGWDGTLWAIDASGAPHLYDPTQNQWNPYGDGVDAVAAVGNTLYLFRNGESLAGESSGGQVIQVDLTNNQAGKPEAIGNTWQALPDSFKIGVTGAANLGGTLHLFKGGWYLPVSKPTARAKLTATPRLARPHRTGSMVRSMPWSATAAASARTARYPQSLRAARNTSSSTSRTAKLFSDLQRSARGQAGRTVCPPVGKAGGWDGAVYLQQNGATVIHVYRGPQVASFPQFSKTVVRPQYIAAMHTQWPANWNAVINHAPSGRMGNLWASSHGGRGTSA